MLRVNGGPTGAGTRVVREPATEWMHDCDGRTVTHSSVPEDIGRTVVLIVALDAAYVRCPACGARRP